MEDPKSVEAICGRSTHRHAISGRAVDVKQADVEGRPLDHDEVVRGQDVRVGFFFVFYTLLETGFSRARHNEQQQAMLTTQCSLHTTQYTTHNTHYTLLTTHYTIHTAHNTLHCRCSSVV